MQGALPLASPGLNPRGTGAGGVSRAGGGVPSESPTRRKTDRTAILLAVPAAKERGDRGRGTSAFEMVLSPGAGRTNAARGAVPCPPSGGTGAGAYHALAGACLLCRLPTLPSVYFSAPYPPARARRALFPGGEGGDQGYFMQGASPLASPGLNPGGTYGTCQENAKRGACSGVACPAAAVPGGRAVLPPCLRDLPEPSPAGGGREASQRRGLAGGKEGKLPPCSCALQKNFQKPLTEAAQYDIIAKRCQDSGKSHGGVAQLARATGSYPVGHRFKSGLRYHIGQGSAVPYPSGTALVRGFPPGPLVKRPKTPPFHGGNSSSNLLRVTK